MSPTAPATTCATRSTRRRCADELGWAPKHTDFEDGLRATIDWYRDNESWWRPTEGRVEATYGSGPVTVRELAVPGAWEITPKLHADARGVFFEWFTEPGFTAIAGHRFDLRQANCSVSAAGVLRGLHFAQLPPSQAKYVDLPARRGVRRGGRHPGRLTDLRAVGLGAARRPRPPVGVHLRGPGARFPCAAR